MVSINAKYQLSKRQLVLHIAVFFIIWTGYEIIGAPFAKQQSILFFNMSNPIIKLLVWTLPVLITLKWARKDVLSYLKMKLNIKSIIKWSIAVSVLNIGYNLLMKKLFYINFLFNPFFDINVWIGGVILIGFTEEILFRGYFLQRIESYITFWNANIITSLLFLVIHFPIWYVHSTEIANGLGEWLLLAAFVFGFSIIQGYILKKSNSLWPCIIMHSVNNFIANALV